MLNQETFKKIFDQVMNIWALPEIEKRKQKGKIKKDFEIKRVQVIFTLGEPARVSFNEEVEIRSKVKAKRDIVKGEGITPADIDKVERFIVDCPPNSGHITLFHFIDSWIFILDTIYNKEKIRKMIKHSKEFYKSTKDDLKNKRWRPFYENCWNSAELSASCHALSIGGKVKGHGENIKNFVKWGELGNVRKEHVDVLSRLKELRRLKYDINSTDSKDGDPEEILKTVNAMIKEAEKLIRD